MNLAGTVRIYTDETSIVAAIDWKGEQLRWKLEHDGTKPLDDFKSVWELVVADIIKNKGEQ